MARSGRVARAPHRSGAGAPRGRAVSYRITALGAIEILASRGRPTLEVHVELDGGAVGVAAVPSGSSKPRGGAVERRDADPDRFGGTGVRSVVATVEEEIADAVVGTAW